MYLDIKKSITLEIIYSLLLILSINILLIHSTIIEHKNDESINSNKNNSERGSKQLFINFDEKDIATISPTFITQQYNLNKENDNFFDYQDHGINSQTYTSYFQNDENNKNLIKMTANDEDSKIYDGNIKLKNYIKTNNNVLNYTSFDNSKDNRDEIKSIQMIDTSFNKNTDKNTISMTREGKDFTYAYPGSASDSVGSSTNSFSSSGVSSGSYKYPYPYSGSSDPGSASYYYHDDKNFWQTAPPAITPEKPVPGPTMLECHPAPMSGPGIFSELFRVGGLAKVSIIKTILIAVLAILVIKIPAFLILKAIIFKAVLIPFAAISIMLPVLLPLLYFWPNLATTLGIPTATQTPPSAAAPVVPAAPPAAPAANGAAAPSEAPPAAPAQTRQRSLFDNEDYIGFFETRAAIPIVDSNNLKLVLLNLINSERCLERIACTLGERDNKSPYRKHISWLLKRMQIALSDDVRRKFKLYRDAYNFGSSKEGICNKGYYPCEIPKVQLIQNSRTYRII